MKRFADLLRTTKNWMLGHKLRAVILALVLVFTAPWPARAQIISPCCALLVAGLSSIQSALTKVVGGGLNQILGVDKAMQQFQQAVVWPQNLINQARRSGWRPTGQLQPDSESDAHTGQQCHACPPHNSWSRFCFPVIRIRLRKHLAHTPLSTVRFRRPPRHRRRY